MSGKYEWNSKTFRIMVDEIGKGNDRVLGIVLGTFIDDLLKQLLLQRLLGHLRQVGLLGEKKVSETVERLFDPDRPLGSFSARTDMCLAMGLIGPVAHGDLGYIRQIRNRFAHYISLPTGAGDMDAASFKIRQILDWCNNLKLVKPSKKPLSADQKFTISCINIFTHIHSGMMARAKKLEEKGSLGQDRPFTP
jgi:DNA-binding MltR family transcriptional regulator